MPTGFAYLTVVLVWATTPLAIKWSAEALPPVMAAMLRMMLAVMIGIPCLWLLRQRLRWDRLAVRAYAAALPGVFGAMALSYMASRYVPSGLISVVFGLAPLLSGVMMQFTAASVRLNAWHWSGCLLGVAGLAVVFSDAMTVADGMLAGLLLLLAAVTGFSISGVMVKQVAVGMHPLAQTMGALTLSLPCYALLSVCLGEQVVLGDNLSGLVAIGYLAVFGSLIGFVSYFVILSRLSAATVALVTLVTPVLALALGALFNGERLPLMALLGAGIILVALALYLLGDRRVRRLAPVGT
ncbi:MAG: DMT family transporter [Alcanivoracaceae bacterium]|nr:DMT family transporter [Alcanivoracaceae bacterium]